SSGELWAGIWFTRTGGLGFELKISLVFVLIAIAAALYVYRSTWNGRKKVDRTQSHLAVVSVVIDGLERTCTGLVDTGNQLYDPLTRTPVMVMEAAIWQAELPQSWIARIRASEV